MKPMDAFTMYALLLNKILRDADVALTFIQIKTQMAALSEMPFEHDMLVERMNRLIDSGKVDIANKPTEPPDWELYYQRIRTPWEMARWQEKQEQLELEKNKADLDDVFARFGL